MRAALWLVGLFAAAVALALFAGDNEGTVTVFWPPHRVDLSVNLALLLLVGLFVLLHLALRALSAVFELPRQARRCGSCLPSTSNHGRRSTHDSGSEL